MSEMNLQSPPQTDAVSSESLVGYKKPHILIVDDDEVSLKIVQAYLRSLYKVTTASSGTEALGLISKQHFDLVLLDYMMPEMDGPTVFSHIRCDFPVPFVPIVFLTAIAEKELVIKGLELHPTDYLLKPVKRSALLERVQRVLDGINS